MLTLPMIAAAVIWFAPPVGEDPNAAFPTQEPDGATACSHEGPCLRDPTPQQRAQAEAEARKNRLRAERAERRAQARALSGEREQERQRGLDSYRF